MVSEGEETPVRRPAVFTVLIVLLAVLFGTAGSQSAQDGTPAGTPVAEVTTVILGSGLPSLSMDAPTLALSRTTFPAGTSAEVYDFGAGGAGPSGVFLASFVSYVESGALVLTLDEGTAELTRRNQAAGTPDANATPVGGVEESFVEISPGEVVQLQTGDSVFFDDARFTLSNDGGVEAIVLNSVLAEEESACPPCPKYPL